MFEVLLQEHAPVVMKLANGVPLSNHHMHGPDPGSRRVTGETRTSAVRKRQLPGRYRVLLLRAQSGKSSAKPRSREIDEGPHLEH